MENLNKQQLIAYRKIINGDNTCIVGEGGTGKSYLCEQIKDDYTLFICPTGMAALNLGDYARTIHSTLMLGPKSLMAWNWEKVKDYIEKNKDKLKVFFDPYKKLVFEESSMIISGLFTTYLNTFHLIYGTSSDILFNGKQIIMILDPLQLPAVKNTCDPYISSSKKVKSKSLTESDLIINHPAFKTLFGLEKGNIIHFNENMRCNNAEWSNVLFHCRTGFKLCKSIEEKHKILSILNSRVWNRKSISPSKNGELVKLNSDSLKTSFKRDYIEGVNTSNMEKLTGPRYTIDRTPISCEEFINLNEDSGYTVGELKKIHTDGLNYMDDLGSYHVIRGYEDGKYIWKTDFVITVGQLVMYRKNEKNSSIRNGSLGEIVKINEVDSEVISIVIKFQNIKDPIEIFKTTYEHPDWNNLKVTAFPIITAFAITIHKLQGQTIKSPLFIHYSNDLIPYYEEQEHLLYTAISRCNKMENVYIISDNEITENHFPVNEHMFNWWRSINEGQPVIVE